MKKTLCMKMYKSVVNPFVVPLIITLLAACSGTNPSGGGHDNDNPNSKENIESPDKTCERGVLSEDKSTCVSATNCEGDHNKCLENYICQANTCIPDNVDCHAEKPCKRGECVDNQCQSKSTCTAATQVQDCMPGEICLGGTCSVPVECASLTCDKSVADCIEKRTACIEAETCTNDDGCKINRFCSSGACKDNLCEVNNVQCDQGICDPLTGSCVEPSVCEKQADCLGQPDAGTGNVCAPTSGSTDKTCQPYTTICSQACRDVTKCEFDKTALEMKCNYSGTCEVTNDCNFNQICEKATKTCVVGTTCAPDKYDALTTSIDFDTEAVDAKIEDLSLCKGDVDTFEMNAAPFEVDNDVIRLHLQLDKTSEGRQVAVQVTLKGVKTTAGTTDDLVTVSNYESSTSIYSQEIALTHNIKGLGYDKIEVVVSRDDTNSKTEYGVDYTLKIDAVDQFKHAICEEAAVNVFPAFTATGTTLKSSLTGLSLETGSFVKGNTFSCNDTGAVGTFPETGFSFTIEGTERKLTTIDLKPTPASSSNYDAVLVVKSDCFGPELPAPNGCIDNKADGEPEVFKQVLEPGTYTVIATAKSDTAVGDFELDVTLEPVTCDITQNTCISDTEKRYCDEYEQKQLTNSCPTDKKCFQIGTELACSNELGGKCDKPLVATETAPIQGLIVDPADHTAQATDGDATLTCGGIIDATDVTGRETYIRAVVPAGGSALVKVVPDASATNAQFSIYTLAQCGAAACESGVNTYAFDATETLGWKNDGTSEAEVIFVVESVKDHGGKFTLDAKVLPSTTCAPSTKRCVSSPSSDSTVEQCKEDGSAWETVETCGTGIACIDTNHAGESVTPRCEAVGDTCENVYELPGDGSVHTFSFKDFDYNGFDAKNGCSTTYTPGGPDIIFAVEAQKDQWIDIRPLPHDAHNMSEKADVVMWRLDSCGASATKTCTDFVDGGIAKEFFTFKVPADGKYYFVVAPFNATDHNRYNRLDKFDISATVQDANCFETLAKPTCDASKTALYICDNETNTKITKVCDDGCDDTTDIHYCKTSTPRKEGQSCAMPFILTGTGGTEPERTLNYNDPYAGDNYSGTFGYFGECSLERGHNFQPRHVGTTGADRVYAVRLAPGQRFAYKVETTGSSFFDKYGRVYLLPESCQLDKCMNMRDGLPLLDSWQYYYADSNQTVYLVVDTMTRTTDFKYILEWKVEAAPAGTVCSPFQSTCVGADVKVCAGDGSSYTTHSCPTGSTCQHGGCTPIMSGTSFAGDTCNDATIPTLTPSDLPAFFTIASNPGKPGYPSDAVQFECGGAKTLAAGSDVFYKVTMPANSILSVRGLSGSYDGNPLVYIGKSCTELGKASVQCLAGSKGNSEYNGTNAFAEYYSVSGEDVVVVLDSERGTPNIEEPYYYHLSLNTNPACSPGAVRCEARSGTAYSQICIGGAWQDQNECLSKICNTGNTECKIIGNDPTEAHQLASTTPAGGIEVVGTLEGSTDTSSSLTKVSEGSTTAVRGSCIFAEEPKGADQYYKIHLNAGDVLTAELKADKDKHPENGAKFENGFLLYLLASDEQTCITDAHTDTTRSLSWETQKPRFTFQSLYGGDYYIVVDNTQTTLSEFVDYKLTYTVSNSTTQCIPRATECAAGGTDLTICKEDGSGTINVTCPYGCIGRACRAESATSPGDSLDMCAAGDPIMPTPILVIYDNESDRLNKDIGFPYSPGSVCPGVGSNSSSTIKSDIFMKVNLNTNEYLYLTDERAHPDVKTTYYVTDENNCTSTSTSCLKGANTKTTPYSIRERGTLLDYSPSAQTDLYLGTTFSSVGSTYSNNRVASALVFVEKKTRECNRPNFARACASTGDSVQYCGDDFTIQEYQCSSGSCANTVCQPASTGDNPFEAIPVIGWTPSGTGEIATVTGDMLTKTSAYGNHVTACSGEVGSRTTGVDAFYSVDIPPNQKLTVTYSTTTSIDLATYMFDRDEVLKYPPEALDGAPHPSCLAGADKGGNGGTETISYTNTTSSIQTVIVAADIYISGGSSSTTNPGTNLTYTMEFKLTP